MQVTARAHEVVLRLQAKPGTRLDTAEISACLDHTIANVEEQQGSSHTQFGWSRASRLPAPLRR